MPSVPPPGGSTDFSLHLWDEVRQHATKPRWSGSLDDRPELRQEFLAGAELLGFRLEPFDPVQRMRELTDPAERSRARARRMEQGYREQLLPQQLMIADALNSDTERDVIEVMRRASKTTSIFIWAMGRCKSRPGYQVTFSAQSGVAGSRRLREWAGILDAVNPPDDLDLPPWLRGQRRTPAAARRHLALFGDDELVPLEAAPTSGRGFKIMRGEVGKGIYFDNDSQFLVLKPDASAYRGEAADVSWIDEAQEIDPLEGDELLAGLMPLQDTKPGSKVVVSGTAGEAQVGPLWSFLSALRSNTPGYGGLDYAVDPGIDWALLEDEASAMRLVEENHPGVGTLTTLEKMRTNYRELQKPQWAREYLSLWPVTAGSTVIDPDLWEAGQLAGFQSRPARVAFGYDVQPGGGVAAISAAWRDRAGNAYIELVAHRLGTAWLPLELQRLTTKYRTSAAYDPIGDSLATATECDRLTPRPKLSPQRFRDTAAGSVQLVRELERGTLHHAGQQSLTVAAEHMARRDVRGEAGIWLPTRATPKSDITPMVAAIRALRNWDMNYDRRLAGRDENNDEVWSIVA